MRPSDFDKWNKIINELCLVLVICVLGAVIWMSLTGCATDGSGSRLTRRLCPTTDIVTLDTAGWTKQDEAAFVEARKLCAGQVGTEHICLARFVRWEPGEYTAVCGVPGAG